MFGVVIGAIVVGVVAVALVSYHPSNPLSPEEKALQEELRYNSTHGVIVRIESVNRNNEGNRKDYAFTINLFNGESKIKYRYDSTLQFFEVGDIVRLPSGDALYPFDLVQAKEANFD